MCLSLIQENVSLYSSYFIKKEEEDTELDFIIPGSRIGLNNWIKKLNPSDIVCEQSVSTGEGENVGPQLMVVEEVNVPGMVKNDLDSSNSTSDSNSEKESSSDSSSDEDEDQSSQNGSEVNDLNSTNRSLNSETDGEDADKDSTY